MGEAIVLEVVRVTGHSRIAHVGKFALVFMDAEVKQLIGTAESSTKFPWKSLVGEWERR